MPKSKSSRKPSSLAKSSTKPTAKPTAKPSAKTDAPKIMTKASEPNAPRAVVASATPASTSQADAPMLKKKELIDRVVAASGLKKKDVKPAIEATLAVLGRALSDGEELNLQPLGKVKVKNRADKPNGTVINCRIRQSTAAATPKAEGGTIKLATFSGQSADKADPLSEPAE